MNLPITMLERPGARRTDPSTSHQAAQRAVKFANGHKDRIISAMQYLRQSQPYSNAAEIAEASGLTVVQVDRRLIEMLRAGTIEPTGVIRGGYRCWRLV